MSDFKELELGIDDLGSETVEESLGSLLNKMNGVHTVRITQVGVHIIYNPLGITPGEIVGAVLQAGYKINYRQPD